MLYFTSDLHFNHKRIIELSHRPFTDIPQMNQALIDNWNARVENYYDPVYVLGDFAFWYKDAQSLDEIFYQLKGEKHLVVGNHDNQNSKVLKLPWKTLTDLTTVRYEGNTRFILCHFPIEQWWHMERGTIHLHGHTHGSIKREVPHRFDVGVDVWDFGPVRADELLELAGSQPFEPSEYHIS